MKKAFIISILIFQFVSAFSQSKDDTKIFILDLLKEWTPDFYEKGVIIRTYNYSFYDNYLIIKETSFHYDIKYNQSKNVSAKVIDLKFLKSIKYSSNGFGAYGILLKCSNNFPYFTSGTKSDAVIIKEIKNYIDFGNQLPVQYGFDGTLILCNENDYKFKRLHNAFSHLVKLCGGELLDDMFK